MTIVVIGSLRVNTFKLVAIPEEVLYESVMQVTSVCNVIFVCVEVLWPSQPNGVISSAMEYSAILQKKKKKKKKR